jgi:hypothetical protein
LPSVSVIEIYEAVTGVSAGKNRVSGGLLVRCPSADHNDAHPSCLLKPGEGVWTCFSCRAKGGKLDLVVASGHARDRSMAAAWLVHNLRRPQDLQEQPRSEHWSGERAGKTLVATHSYFDADAVLAEQFLRYRVGGGGRSKQFEIRRPDGAGNWIYHHRSQCERPTCACHGTGTLARVVPPILPYYLPGMLSAGRDGRTGILVEGEGDADALIALDFAASTNPYGVDFQYPQNWHRFFDTVPRWIVICDSDTPGRKAAAERTLFLGPSATVVDLFPNDVATKHGRDVSDWLSLHPGSAAEQQAALATALRSGCQR